MGDKMRLEVTRRKPWQRISTCVLFIIALWTVLFYSGPWLHSLLGRIFNPTTPTPSTSTGKGCSSSHGPAPTGDSYASGFDMKQSWAHLSPYKDADWGVPKGVPQGGKCELSQVHVLHRHAQRYPTRNPLDGANIHSFLDKLNESSGTTGPLEFINSWEYVLGLDELMRTGAATEDTSGANFWLQYGRLLYRATPENVVAWDPAMNVYPNGTARPRPVFRTTSQSRIYESARWWLSEYFWTSL